MSARKKLKLTEESEALLKDQCKSCPLLADKCEDVPSKPIDILLVSEKGLTKLDGMFKYPAKHVWTTECIPLLRDSKYKVDATAKMCCLGRKLDFVKDLKPKLVIASGADAFKDLESLFGHLVQTKLPESILLPTRYEGHDFWFMCVPDKNLEIVILEHAELIQEAMETTPVILPGNFDGVEFVTDNSELDEVFGWLLKQDIVAMDIETNGFKPYHDHSRILSLSLGNEERTFSFPIAHPQTPSDFNSTEVLIRLLDLARRVPIIAHNLIFELEWIAYTLGIDFLYAGEYHDTMAQAYLLIKKGSLSLDFCIRRLFGFSLKLMSDIDVANLENTPLEQVLQYNALDVKYTAKLFAHQKKQLEAEDLLETYELQRSRIPAVAFMQLKGLSIDEEFIQVQSGIFQAEIKRQEKDIANLPEVQQHIQTYGKFNPLSNVDIKKLFQGQLKIKSDNFDEEVLRKIKHPLAKHIIDLRLANGIFSKYILPFNKNEPEGGELIFADNKIHTNFHTLFTATGRLSSSQPNVQNFPSHGGLKYIRNVVTAPPGYLMVAIDYGQIEARLIAALSQDEVLIQAIKDDYDIHMEWALKLIKLLPGTFVKDETDKKEVKAFRGNLKTAMVFPLLYGSSQTNVMDRGLAPLGLKFNSQKYLTTFFQDFWKRHKDVKPWHKRLNQEYTRFKCIRSPFKRKYRAPLRYTEIINYPVQGSASDIVVIAMTKLARLAYELNEPDICPVLNVHDDLTFYIPEDRLSELMPLILDAMLDTSDYEEWLSVPLTIEVSVGKSWGILEEFHTFSSVDHQKALETIK